MKKKLIIPTLAVIVAIAIAFAGTATAKVAPRRGNTPKIMATMDSFDPLRCGYVDPFTNEQCPRMVEHDVCGLWAQRCSWHCTSY